LPANPATSKVYCLLWGVEGLKTKRLLWVPATKPTIGKKKGEGENGSNVVLFLDWGVGRAIFLVSTLTRC